MKKYTIIGFYSDNLQPWSSSVEAHDWEAAIEVGRDQVSEGLKVRVCAVIEGDHRCVDGLHRVRDLQA